MARMAGLWYENAVFYGVDVRRFQDSNGDGFGDLPGLTGRLDYLKELGVDALWLLPFYDSPLGDNGYDVRDYLKVDPRVGDLNDFANLVKAAHERGIHLIVDLVMNHTSNQHPWFQASRRDPRSRFRNYYVWSDALPKEKIPGELAAFPGEENSVWTYDPLAKAYYFHRFYHFQPDLRNENPEVQEEMFKVIDFWLAMGVDGFRFDAEPLMLEQKGLMTSPWPDPHLLFRHISTLITERRPDAVLLGEANVPLDQVPAFFGGDSEMNMLLNFQLGPHILLAFTRKSARPLRDYLEDQYNPEGHDTWMNFLRNFDELTLDTLPAEQREVILEKYAPDGAGRIYNRGIRRRITPILSEGHRGMARHRVELAFSLLFSAPGAPLFMYGDEIGMGDDLSLPGRDAVRTPMQWDDSKNGGFSTSDHLIAPVIGGGPYGYEQVNAAREQADPNSFWHFVRRLIEARKKCPEIGVCPVDVMDGAARRAGDLDDRLLVSCYPSMQNEKEVALILIHNLGGEELEAEVPVSGEHPEAILGNGKVLEADGEKMKVALPEYGYLWVRLK